MADVTMRIPRMLADLVGAPLTLDLEARTASGALAVLVDVHPELRVHVFDEGGDLRPHVLCFVNDRNLDWLDGDPELTDGDRLTVLQSVSGG